MYIMLMYWNIIQTCEHDYVTVLKYIHCPNEHATSHTLAFYSDQSSSILYIYNWKLIIMMEIPETAAFTATSCDQCGRSGRSVQANCIILFSRWLRARVWIYRLIANVHYYIHAHTDIQHSTESGMATDSIVLGT